MQRVRSSTTGLSYLVSGDASAPLAMLLHGFPDIPTTWRPLARELALAGYRVVCPWMPGYAPSLISGPLDFATVTRRVQALVDELSPHRPAFLIGHDWGAVMSYLALAMQPHRFAAASTMAVPHPLALLGNLARFPRQLARSWYMGFFQLPALAERAIRYDDFALVERLWKTWSPGLQPDADHLRAIKQCLGASLPAPLGYYRALRSVAARRDALRVLRARKVTIPTLYIHGGRDGCIGIEMARGQAAHFKSGPEMLALPDAGHFLHLEQPALVSEAIVRWFARARS